MSDMDGDIQVKALNYVCKTLENSDFIQIAKKMQVKIPGFTPKNFNNVPPTILKSHTLKKILKIRKPLSFLSSFVENKTDDFKDVEYKQFMYMMEMDESIKTAQKIALLITLFPDEYLQNEIKIHENLDNKRDPLFQIIDSNPTALDNLLIWSLNYKLKNKDLIIKLINTTTLFENNQIVASRNIDGTTLRELIISNPKKKDEFGFFLIMLNEFIDEIDSWSHEEKSLYYEMALNESLFINTILAVDNVEEYNQNIDKVKKDLHKELETKNKEIKFLAQKNERQSTDYETLLMSSKEKEKEIKELKKSLKTAIDDKSKITQQKTVLEENFKKSEDIKASLNNKEESFFKECFEDENNFCLFTFRVEHIFSALLKEDHLFQLKSPNDLLEVIYKDDSFIKKIIFINIDGLSAKQQSTVEKELDNTGLTYRFVNDGPINIIRTIIYYLEGEFRYEIKI